MLGAVSRWVACTGDVLALLATVCIISHCELVGCEQVGECLGTFWRPSFDLAMFPYLPAHCTRPKEVRKLFLVPLPEKCYFAVRLAESSFLAWRDK